MGRVGEESGPDDVSSRHRCLLARQLWLLLVTWLRQPHRQRREVAVGQLDYPEHPRLRVRGKAGLEAVMHFLGKVEGR